MQQRDAVRMMTGGSKSIRVASIARRRELEGNCKFAKT